MALPTPYDPEALKRRLGIADMTPDAFAPSLPGSPLGMGQDTPVDQPLPPQTETRSPLQLQGEAPTVASNPQPDTSNRTIDDPAFGAFLKQETAPQRERGALENIGNILGGIGGGLRGKGYDESNSKALDQKYEQDQAKDPNSAYSQQLRQSHAPLLKQLGLKDEEIAHMSAADIQSMGGGGNIVESLLQSRQRAQQSKSAQDAQMAAEARKTAAEQAKFDRENPILHSQQMEAATAKLDAEKEREMLREGSAMDRAKLAHEARGSKGGGKAGGGGGATTAADPLPGSVADTPENRDQWDKIQKLAKSADRTKAELAFMKNASKPPPGQGRTDAANARGQQARASNIAKLSTVREVGESEIGAAFNDMEKTLGKRGNAFMAKAEGGVAGLVGARGAALPDEARYNTAKEQMIAAAEKMVTMGVPHSDAVTRAIHNLPAYTDAGALEQLKGVREMYKGLAAASKKALEDAQAHYSETDIFNAPAAEGGGGKVVTIGGKSFHATPEQIAKMKADGVAFSE